LTAYDDGNPATFEFSTYGYDKNYGGEAWGKVHGYFADEGDYVWVNSGGENVCNDPSLDKFLGFVSPAVHAAPAYGCGGFDWRYAIRRSAYAGFAGGFFGLLNPACWGAGPGVTGGCFAASFVGGFASQLGYEIFDYSWWCNVMQ
jgi:hypothetical protein